MFCITRKTQSDWVPSKGQIVYGALDRTAPAHRFGEHCYLIQLRDGLVLDEDFYEAIENGGATWIPKNRVALNKFNEWICFRADQILSVEYLGAFPHDIYVEDYI